MKKNGRKPLNTKKTIGTLEKHLETFGQHANQEENLKNNWKPLTNMKNKKKLEQKQLKTLGQHEKQ